MPVAAPYVSIIILTKNGSATLNRVLKAVFGSRVDFSYEVIAVDSGSTDNTKEILCRYPVKLIEIPAYAFSHGGTRNFAANIARGEVLVFLTQDAVPADDQWLAKLIGDDFKEQAVAAVFGRQLADKTASAIEKFFLSFVYPEETIIKSGVDPRACLLKDIFFSDVNSAIRKADWQENRFNETLIMSEDQEWSRRMLLKNRKIVYKPQACVVHSHNYGLKKIFRRNFDSGISLKGVVDAPFLKALGFEWNYLKQGFIYLWKKQAFLSLLKFPFYEACRCLGFFLGFHNKYLPLPLKRFFSQHKNYWGTSINNN